MRRLASSIAVCATLAAAPVALGGTISGTAFMDYNSNGVQNTGGLVAGTSNAATDAGVGGVTVAAYDASGAQVATTTSAANGTYSLTTPGSGTVRVQFTPPAGYEPSFRGASDGTSVQFVQGSGTGVDFAVTKATQYCQDNPRLVTCLQPMTDMLSNAPAHAGVVSFPSAFSAAQSFDHRAVVDGRGAETTRLSAGVQTVSAAPTVGSVFGTGVDRSGFAYFGTFVKRHSQYGPEGAKNAIYRVNLATGATSTFVVLGPEVLPAHNPAAPAGWPPYSVDGIRAAAPASTYYSDVYRKVGRAGLGDVDVSPDGTTLYAVEMTEAAPKLWIVPIADPGSRTSVAITAPATFGGVTCELGSGGRYHPMALSVTDDRVLVGGICGGDETQWVNGSGRTQAAAFVAQLLPDRSGFTTIAATSLAYNKGGAYRAELLLNWNQASAPSTSDSPTPGLWRNWSDAAPAWTPGMPSYASWPEPMLANIEVMQGGDLVLAFRDRFQDQVAFGAVTYEWSGTGSVPTRGYWDADVAGAELLRLCSNGNGTYTRESGGTCNGVTGGGATAGDSAMLGNPAISAADRANSPLFYAASWVRSDFNGLDTPVSCAFSDYYGCALHGYTSLGGTATLPGSPVLWSTNYDINSYFQQGVRAFGACPARAADVGNCGPTAAADGAPLGGVVLSDDAGGSTPYSFRKGNGLADLEMICDAAPVQVGNRVWIDSNANGIQDPGEPAVAGATLHLYDSAGSLVGTAVTGTDGTYYFSSNSQAPAAGDGTSAGGGLRAGAAFTIRMDNPADYASGGPLEPYALTTPDAASPGNAANSKATLSGGYPSIAVPARSAGQNNHTFDIGLVRRAQDAVPSEPTATSGTASSLVAIGNYVWVDRDRNGLQGERPLKGVRVVLLTATGGRARNAAGAVVPATVTDAAGRYVFAALAPGAYRVRFILPSGYRFTTAGKPGSTRNSNPTAAPARPRVGTTPVFRVYGQAKGDTVPNRNPKINAAFIDPTIDAGVVPTLDPSGFFPVTG